VTGLLLRRARLAGGPEAPVDVAVEDGRVTAVSPTGTGPADASTPAEVVDLDGRWLLPGLWDSHVHMEQQALRRRQVDVAGAASAAEAAAMVARHVAEHPPGPGTVVVGAGFRDGLWPDLPAPGLLELGDVAVCLVSGDVHTIWSNLAATRRFGLGEQDWLLREQPAFDLGVRLRSVDEAEVDAAVAEATAAAAARGVVGVVDLEMGDAGGSWLRRAGARPLDLRVEAGVYPEDLGTALARGQRTGRPVTAHGALDAELVTGGLVTGGPFKIFSDGSLNTRTAYCYHPYAGSGRDVGLASHEPDELVALLHLAVRSGLRPTVHAIGDRAVTMALDAYEAVARDGGPRGGRVEHAQLVRPEDVPRFAALGVEAGLQPEHAMDDRDVADHYWAGRTGQAFALRSLLDAGATVLLGSDAPVAPLDPWVTVAAAVSRSRDGRSPWHPEQRITVAEALRCSTRSTVAPGQPADLVVTDLDPYAVQPERLRTMPVAATLLAGRWTAAPRWV